jgi:hypothetical protein
VDTRRDPEGVSNTDRTVGVEQGRVILPEERPTDPTADDPATEGESRTGPFRVGPPGEKDSVTAVPGRSGRGRPDRGKGRNGATAPSIATEGSRVRFGVCDWAQTT